MRKILVNAFSAQMLNIGKDGLNVRFEEIKKEEVEKDCESAIGHTDTAAVLSELLGFEVKFKRANIKLDNDTILFLAQLDSGRLPEGATTLPDGFSFRFFKVFLQ